MPGFEDFDDGLRPTKTHQSLSKPGHNKKQDMSKLMEERSFTNVNTKKIL